MHTNSLVARSLLSLSLFAALALPASARAGLLQCRGDCGGDGIVTIDEIIRGVRIALELEPLASCAAMDASGDLAITIDELMLAMNDLLDGCPPAPPSATPTAMATAPSATPSPEPATETPPPSATPTPTVAAATETPDAPAPSGLAARVEGDLVVLTWTKPDPGSGYTQTRLLRRLNAAVTGPDDAEAIEIYSGADAEAGDPLSALLPSVPEQPRTYHYAVYACTDGGQCESAGSAATLAPTLPQVLRAGGYVLHWRHADADVCADQFCGGTAAAPLVPDWWRSCEASCAGPARPGECPPHSGTAMARQLNDAGRLHAIAIGEAFDTLAIPVARVVTSEFCRNFQTAELFDFGPAYELNQSITFFVYDEAMRCEHSFALLREAPAGGANTALIGHAGNECPPLSDLAWSEAAVYKPDGAGETTFVTRVTWDQWEAMIPPGPSELTAAVDGPVVRLAWRPPDPTAGYAGVRVLRRLNAPVEGPDDPAAVEIYAGGAAETADPLTALLPDVPAEPRTYHYAVYGCFAPDGCEETGSADAVTPTLVDALRAGGYVIVWRHADADVCSDRTNLGTAANPVVPDWWKSCDADCNTATARQMSDAGREHAIAIGAAFDARAIPIGRVITSEFCRNFQTAELFDFGPAYELNQDITYFVYDEAERCNASYALAAEPPASGTNTAVIGHAGFPSPCAIFGTLAWSEAAIFKPDGQGGQRLIERVTWDRWVDLP